MKVNATRIRELCELQGLSISRLLAEAGVSRNAYYSLLRRKTIMPRSLRDIARALRTTPDVLLRGRSADRSHMEALLAEADAIVRRYRGIDPDTVRHTLLLLDEEPIERLRRALRRGGGNRAIWSR